MRTKFLLAAGLLAGAAVISLSGCSMSPVDTYETNTDDTVYIKEITQTLDNGDSIRCLVFNGGEGAMSCDWLAVHGYDKEE